MTLGFGVSVAGVSARIEQDRPAEEGPTHPRGAALQSRYPPRFQSRLLTPESVCTRSESLRNDGVGLRLGMPSPRVRHDQNAFRWRFAAMPVDGRSLCRAVI